MSDFDKYTKIVYQSDPIGKDKIILYLTTFDLEAYNRNHDLKEIPTKRVYRTFEIPDADLNKVDFLEILERDLKNFINDVYAKEIEELKNQVIVSRVMEYAIPATENKIIKGNVVNTDKVECDVINGNVVNCDTVYCNTIKGNTVNCEIYRKE